MMRISKANTLAVLIDVQEKLFPHIHENEVLLQNISVALAGLKILKVPLIVSEQYVKGLGKTVSPLRDYLAGNGNIEKMEFSCCGNAKFNIELAHYNKEFILLMGIEAHVCVLQTAIDLKENGFQPIVVDDCISSRKPNDKKIALERMKGEGVTLTTYESILFELCELSGTDEFKAISKLVK